MMEYFACRSPAVAWNLPRPTVTADHCAKSGVHTYAGVDEIMHVASGDTRSVSHPRQPFGGRSVDYRHYFRGLAASPGVAPGRR